MHNESLSPRADLALLRSAITRAERSAGGRGMGDSWYPAPRTGERIVHLGRLLVAAIAVFTAIVDAGSFHSPVVLRSVVAAYAVYALILVATRRFQNRRLWRILSHVIDLVFFSTFMLLAPPESAAAFAFLTFAILWAAIRFDVLGTLMTAAAVLLVFSAIGTARAGSDVAALQQAAIRTAHMALVGGLMVYLSMHLNRLHSELSGLAAWPREFSRDTRQVVGDVLRRAAAFVGVRRVVMTWTAEEEPWVYVASWAEGQSEYSRERPGLYEPMVDAHLTHKTFFCPDAGATRPRVIYAAEEEKKTECASVVHPDLRHRFKMKSVLSMELAGETFRGRIFYLDRSELTADDLRLGEIVGRLIVARLDHFYLAQEGHLTAIAEERVRLARDLHDGLLQSLTAASLQVEAARRLMHSEPGKAQHLLTELHDDIIREHEDLRSFIRDLRPAPGDLEPEFRLQSRLRDLAALVERQWAVQVDLLIDSAEGIIPESSRKEVYRLVREAVVNAAKHAAARRVSVDCTVEDALVRIIVKDDGLGFPFHGTFRLRELMELKKGPRTLKERIAYLNGDLWLTSSEAGSRLEIALPLVAQPMTYADTTRSS
jgi:signal transduction histidine kinase